jgi:hypothetical protein
MASKSKFSELSEVMCRAFKLRYATKKFACITGFRAPKEICDWYLVGEGSIGEGLVRMWEGGDMMLNLTDIQVQDLIDAIEGGLVKVVATED